jgi:hypothetical protein
MSAIMVAGSQNTDEQFIFFINTYLYFKEQKFDYSNSHPRIHAIYYYGRKQMAGGRLLLGLINPLHMLGSINGFDHNVDLSCIIASRTTYIATYLYNYFIKKNPNLKLFLVEEGIGEYSNRLIHTRFTRACAFLHQKTHLDRVNGAFFSAPDLYPFDTGFSIKKVPPLNDTSRKVIESMFNMKNIKKDNVLSPYNCIVLSEPTTAELKKQEDIDQYNQTEKMILDTAADVIGSGRIVIKVHPVDPNFKNEQIKTYYTKLPMESLLFNIDAEKKIFISPMSTAMLTPKLLFDKEPFLIFTYKLLQGPIRAHVGNDAALNRYIAFVHDVISAYKDPSKCAVPQSLEELREALRAFSRRAKELQTKE